MVTKTVLARAGFEVLSVRGTNAPSSRRVAAWRGTWLVQVRLDGPDDGHAGKRGSQRIASVLTKRAGGGRLVKLAWRPGSRPLCQVLVAEDGVLCGRFPGFDTAR